MHNPTTLRALFKCLLIETEEDKVRYSEDIQREYSDETNRKGTMSRMQFDLNTRVSELVFFLPFNVEGNNGFTHIHNPLLLLLHRSMDGKGHAQKLCSH